jgi:hypothetical protein
MATISEAIIAYMSSDNSYELAVAGLSHVKTFLLSMIIIKGMNFFPSQKRLY